MRLGKCRYLQTRWLEGTLFTPAGACSLRTNVGDRDEETLWRTCSTPTGTQAVFRPPESEPRLVPMFHRTAKRAGGHLSVTVIACRPVQTIRRRLNEFGGRQSPAGLRRILEDQQRVTAAFRRGDGRILRMRKATGAEPQRRPI